MKLNMTLFEKYKVASKLPHDAFQNICMQAAEEDVSCFSPEGNKLTVLQELVNREIKYESGENYYRQVWKFYLDNEQLLKEV